MRNPVKRGLYKVQMGFVTQHSLGVMLEPYDPFEVAEGRYRKEGYEPDFHGLPWQHEPEADPLDAAGRQKNLIGAVANELGPMDLAFPDADRPDWLEQSIRKLASSRFMRQTRNWWPIKMPCMEGFQRLPYSLTDKPAYITRLHSDFSRTGRAA